VWQHNANTRSGDSVSRDYSPHLSVNLTLEVGGIAVQQARKIEGETVIEIDRLVSKSEPDVLYEIQW